MRGINTVAIGGVPFQVTTLEASAAWLVRAAVSGEKGVPIRLANAYCVALAQRDAAYAAVLCGAGLNLPDGAPIAWFMRRRAMGRAAERVRGPSFFEEVLRTSEGSSVQHYFLGSTPETIDRLVAEVRRRYPGARVAGQFSPPFGPVDDAFVADAARRVSATEANLIWIGMGTPKQDFAAARLSAETGLHSAGVGAAFDFLAGTVREAPRWVQRSGLEWLYRLLTEPRRLWRRYLIGNAVFLKAALTDKRGGAS